MALDQLWLSFGEEGRTTFFPWWKESYSTLPREPLPGNSGSKTSACNAGRKGLIPGSGRSPWEGNDYPLQFFLPGESHGLRSLAGYSPWDYKRVRHDWVTNTHFGAFYCEVCFTEFIISSPSFSHTWWQVLAINTNQILRADSELLLTQRYLSGGTELQRQLDKNSMWFWQQQTKPD